jgi:mannose-6-phosphate isomerase-like protein (cupin superfamily)
MQIRSLDRANLAVDNQLHAQRLMPWPSLNAPFEGSWCVVEPGGESGPHAHDEFEIWVAVTGSAEIVAGQRRCAFTAGDIAYFVPGETHQVVNAGTDDFEMYSLWWDAELAGAFAARIAERAS